MARRTGLVEHHIAGPAAYQVGHHQEEEGTAQVCQGRLVWEAGRPEEGHRGLQGELDRSLEADRIAVVHHSLADRTFETLF